MGPVEGVGVADVGGVCLPVLGVPFRPVLNPLGGAVHLFVALVVDESACEVVFVGFPVVGVEGCPVEVLGRVAVHGASAVVAFGAVFVVVEELFASGDVGVAVTALSGGLLRHGIYPLKRRRTTKDVGVLVVLSSAQA